jgi:hypothetical protein
LPKNTKIAPLRGRRPTRSVIGEPVLARLVQRVAPAPRRDPAEVAVLVAAVDLPAIAARADDEDRHAPRAARLAPRLRLVPHPSAQDAPIPCLGRLIG